MIIKCMERPIFMQWWPVKSVGNIGLIQSREPHVPGPEEPTKATVTGRKLSSGVRQPDPFGVTVIQQPRQSSTGHRCIVTLEQANIWISSEPEPKLLCNPD